MDFRVWINNQQSSRKHLFGLLCFRVENIVPNHDSVMWTIGMYVFLKIADTNIAVNICKMLYNLWYAKYIGTVTHTDNYVLF